MLLSPPERAEAAEPLGDEGSLGPDPERPFVPPALYLPSTGVPNARAEGVAGIHGRRPPGEVHGTQPAVGAVPHGEPRRAC